MRKVLHIFMLVGCLSLLSNSNVQAQIPGDSTSLLSIPVGYANIGGEDYFGLRIQPELSFGKIGVGLDVPLFWGEDGFRDEEFRDGLGVLRMVRFFRYGRKGRDPVYVKVGMLQGERLGSGFLVNNYGNSPSFERRKVGAVFDIRIKDHFGVEGLYSDFNRFNMAAVRPYVRPLANSFIPILETMEVGFTYVTDFTPQYIDETAELVDTRFVRKGFQSFGADVQLTVLETGILDLKAYANFAVMPKLGALSDSVDAYIERSRELNSDPDPANDIVLSDPIADGYTGGIGGNIGAVANLDILTDVLNLEVRLERQWYSEHFTPQFFDAVYEINKDAKLWQLANTGAVQGTYGTLSGRILNKITLTGGLQIPDDVSETNPALVFVNLDANEFIPKIILNGTYIKGGLANLKDAFSLDERSLATMRIAYRVNKFLVAGLDYRWTFSKVIETDAAGMDVERFKATEYVMPYVGFYYPLDF